MRRYTASFGNATESVGSIFDVRISPVVGFSGASEDEAMRKDEVEGEREHAGIAVFALLMPSTRCLLICSVDDADREEEVDGERRPNVVPTFDLPMPLADSSLTTVADGTVRGDEIGEAPLGMSCTDEVANDFDKSVS